MESFPANRSFLVAVVFAILALSAQVYGEIQVRPATVVLAGPEAAQQLLVLEKSKEGQPTDLTRTVSYRLSRSDIAVVNQGGLVRPLAEGQAQLLIRHQDRQIVVPVQVKGLEEPVPVSFRHEVLPILTKARCNSSGCHGKAEGQNGFKLSVFSFDPAADYGALVKESRGRRVSPAAPDHSLMLLKMTGRVPHGGGRKLEPDSDHYRRVRRWISEGARFTTEGDSLRRFVGIEVDPRQIVLSAGQSQQVRVTALDAAGNRYCVTQLAEYESNADSIATVDGQGLVRSDDVPGEVVILVRYLSLVTHCQVTNPRLDVHFARPPEPTLIDGHVWDKLARLGVAPSDLADDGTFLRRVFLDSIGTLPTAEEARQFLEDPSSDKRSRLIDQLLSRDEYADYWAMRWLDILRADQLKITPQGTVAMQRWLRSAFAENRPYDQMARELLTVQGNTSTEGPGSFYKILKKPDEVARSFSQLLLGVRIECAQCHHHPSEKWSQEDYVGLAGFFTGVTLKTLPGGAKSIVSRGGENLKHPRTGEPVSARALGAEAADFSSVADRRVVLADWMTAPKNPYFARAIANRLWAHYFSRGLIEPIDDIRDTNPATNEPLMDALATHMGEVNYDLQRFTRTLLHSRVYQLSASPNSSNEKDFQNFSHASYKALPAEVLLDAICQSAGVTEKFNGWPDGYRSIQIWDNRMPSYFFRIFGRPARTTVCECERSNQPSIAQALHLLNSPEIMEKIGSRRGRARKLAESELSDREIIDELYLATLSRFPAEEEQQLMLQAFSGGGSGRHAAVEDILWTLLNSKEFLYNH